MSMSSMSIRTAIAGFTGPSITRRSPILLGERRSTISTATAMTKVEEPNPTLATPVLTTYTYNALGKMTQSNQVRSARGSSIRWAAQRAKTLPEPGTTTFTYNADSRGYLVCWADRAVTCLAALGVSRCPGGPSRSRCRRHRTLTPAQSEEARHRRHHDDWTR